MFAIGSTETKVHMNKVNLPKEFHLRRKDRKIYGTWVGESYLYLSDERNALRNKAGKNGMVYIMDIGKESTITVPSYLEHSKVIIQGNISVIELKFIL